MTDILPNIQDVYFDESGNTGNDLLNNDQRFYSYAGVAIKEDAAKKIVGQVRAKYNLQGKELKYSKMKKYSKGRHAIDDILNAVKDCSTVICTDKRYALCANFFEYIIEPCASDRSTLFYNAGFNHFFTLALYDLYFTDKKPSDLMIDFCRFMEETDKRAGAEFFLNKYTSNRKRISKKTPFEELIKIFMTQNRGAILSEMNNISGGDGIDRFTLDLALTSLFSAAVNLSGRFGKIHIIYDNSSILETNQEVFDSLTNGKHNLKSYNYLNDNKQMTFDFDSVESGESSSLCALQLADIVSGAALDAYKNRDTDKERYKYFLQNQILSQVVSRDILKNSPQEVFYTEYEEVFFEIVKNLRNNKPLLDINVVNHLAVLAQVCEEFSKRIFEIYKEIK